VDEVGNPTILATLTVIAAILPMAFVGGLMGPYMRPIPIGATAAMIFSLIVAFIVTPWAAIRLLKRPATAMATTTRGDRTTAFTAAGWTSCSQTRRYGFLGGVVVLLLGSMALVYIGSSR
jgi:multidrug efflux pump subunit AcrB